MKTLVGSNPTLFPPNLELLEGSQQKSSENNVNVTRVKSLLFFHYLKLNCMPKDKNEKSKEQKFRYLVSYVYLTDSGIGLGDAEATFSEKQEMTLSFIENLKEKAKASIVKQLDLLTIPSVCIIGIVELDA